MPTLITGAFEALTGEWQMFMTALEKGLHRCQHEQ